MITLGHPERQTDLQTFWSYPEPGLQPSDRQTFGGPPHPLSRNQVTTLGQIYKLLVAPHTPYPELGLQPSDRQTDLQTFGGPPHPLSRTRVTTLGQIYRLLVAPPHPAIQNSGYNITTLG